MKPRDVLICFVIAIVAGAAGWFVRDRAMPRPGLQTVHDTIVKIIPHIVQGRTIVVRDLAAADSERVKRQAAESELTSIIASLGDTATAPEPVKALVRACSALMSSCQLETAHLRTAAARSDSLLTSVYDVLQFTRDSLANAARVSSHCTDPSFIRAVKGTVLGAGVGNVVGLIAGVVTGASVTDGMTIGAIGGAVGGFAGATTARCT